MFRISICVVLLVSVFAATTNGINDTVFDSRFEYEYRVIEKLVQLENDNRVLRNIVANLTEKLEGTLLKSAINCVNVLLVSCLTEQYFFLLILLINIIIFI